MKVHVPNIINLWLKKNWRMALLPVVQKLVSWELFPRMTTMFVVTGFIYENSVYNVLKDSRV